MPWESFPVPFPLLNFFFFQMNPFVRQGQGQSSLIVLPP